MDVLTPAAAAVDRVALIVPRWTPAGSPVPQGLPFRTFTMGGAFLHAGYEVVFFDQEHDLDSVDRFGELLTALAGCRAAFLWMNEMYPFEQSQNVLRLATRIKAARPDLPVVAGGEFISVCPPELFDVSLPIDYFLRGYGERSGLRLLDDLRAHRMPDDVPGLVWRDGAGALRHQPADRRPFFAAADLELYRRLDLERYVQIGGVIGNDQRTLTISTGRGCVKGCSFCCWSTHPAKVMQAEPIVELMQLLRDRFGVHQFHIGELDFFMSRTRVLALADLLARRLPDVRWFALGSPIDLIGLSAEDWDRLRAGGLVKVEMGSESGSLPLLRAIGKRHDPEHIYELSVRMLTRRIVPMNNWMFGFPGETRADRAASLRLIDRIWQLSPELNHMTFRYFQPVWGTGCGDAANAHDPDPARRIDEWLRRRLDFHREEVRSMPWLPAADELEVKRLINYQLPLMTSKHAPASPLRRTVYRVLRQRAHRAVPRDRRSSGLDRWLYRRMVGLPLDQTYVP